MFENKNQVIESIDAIMYQALKVVEKRDYDLGIVHIYYVGGTLCLDIYNRTKFQYLIMVNIEGESFSVVTHDVKDESSIRILPIEALKLAFIIYDKVKGKTQYHKECFEKSCLRHLEKPFDVKVKFENKILTYGN